MSLSEDQHLPRPRGPQCNAARSYFRLLALSESRYIAAAMSRAAKAVSMTKAEARHIWLRAQRLDMPAPFGEGPAATAAAVEHLGYVQIDTINVIERCHHHILWTRIPNYRRADLRQAQSVDKSVFEYWTHALSYVPAKDLRFFIPAMKRHRREGHKWLNSVSPADLRKVMRLIRRDGALTIRDIDDDVLVDKQHPWASRKPSKRALQLAFYQGLLTISERNGMLKTYELMARHFGWDVPSSKPPKPASARETHAYLLDRALRAQGVVSLDSICHLDAPSKAAIRRLIESRVRAGALVPVALEGAGKQEHWAAPETLEATGDRACRRWCISCRRSIPSSSSASGPNCSSATGIASRPMCRKKSGCSAISHCRFWWATTSSPPSISRPIARPANYCCRNGVGSAVLRAGARARISSAGSSKSCTVSSGFNWRRKSSARRLCS